MSLFGLDLSFQALGMLALVPPFCIMGVHLPRARRHNSSSSRSLPTAAGEIQLETLFVGT
jgi:hypothetical protein